MRITVFILALVGTRQAFAAGGITPNCDMISSGGSKSGYTTTTAISETDADSYDQCSAGSVRLIKYDSNNIKASKCLDLDSCTTGEICQYQDSSGYPAYKCVKRTVTTVGGISVSK